MAQAPRMRPLGLPLLAVAAALVAGSAASAQEVVRTGPDGAPPAPAVDPGQPPQAIDGGQSHGPLVGPWLDAAPAPAAALGQAARCAPPPDRKPHGEVWAGIGTGGYREAGAVVTKPLGDCGSVTVAIDHLSIDSLRRH